MPTIQIEPDRDTDINSAAPTTNTGTSTSVNLVRNTGGTSTRRVITSFRLSPIAGQEIVSASLRFRFSAGSASQSIDIHALDTDDWVESEATWNARKSGVDWDTPGGDYDATVIDNQTNSTAPSDLVFDVTDHIAAVVDSGRASFLMKFNTESGANNTCQFYSAEQALASNHPYLEVEYNTVVGGGLTPTGEKQPSANDAFIPLFGGKAIIPPNPNAP